MKRFICIMMIVVLLFILSGCYNKSQIANKADNDGRMTLLYNDRHVVIYQDNQTGVQYISKYRAGTCVMVNPDGTPYIGENKNND